MIVSPPEKHYERACPVNDTPIGSSQRVAAIQSLAHAHAKSGDAALISGYLGKANDIDQAIGEFAISYAD